MQALSLLALNKTLSKDKKIKLGKFSWMDHNTSTEELEQFEFLL